MAHITTPYRATFDHILYLWDPGGGDSHGGHLDGALFGKPYFSAQPQVITGAGWTLLYRYVKIIRPDGGKVADNHEASDYGQRVFRIEPADGSVHVGLVGARALMAGEYVYSSITVAIGPAGATETVEDTGAGGGSFLSEQPPSPPVTRLPGDNLVVVLI